MAIKISGNTVLNHDGINYSNTNIAAGYLSLVSNTTGIRNTSVGSYSLYANTTGSNNTAIGFNSQKNDPTGSNNTSIGFESLLNSSSGYNNTSIGGSSLFSNTSGGENTAVGEESLYNNTTGYQNTSIGSLSLLNNTTGNLNTVVGYYSGIGITTGSKNTIIGAKVTGLSSSLSNTIIIADGDGNKRIYVDSSGNMGVGTTSPDALLTINTIASFGDGAVTTPSIAHKGDLNTGFWFPAADTIAASTAGSERMRIDSSGNVGIGKTNPSTLLDVNGVISDSIGNVREIPQNSKTAAYTLAATDSGKHISITTGGITVPSAIFTAGQLITIYNDSSSSQTITQGSSVTMYLAGTATTGNRTLAQRGVATILCVASNTFVISGAGVS